MIRHEADDIKIHPAANLFPMMSETEYAGLVKDIEENGVSTCLRFRGDDWETAELVDGRNRLRAIQQLGLDYRDYADISTCEDMPNPVAIVVSLNLHRRQLTPSQLGLVAARIANLKHGSNQFDKKEESPNGDSSVPITIASAAKITGASERNTSRGKAVIASGTEELVKEVESGGLKITVAAKIADLPKAEQPAAIIEAKKPKTQKPKAAPVSLKSDLFTTEDLAPEEIARIKADERYQSAMAEIRNKVRTFLGTEGADKLELAYQLRSLANEFDSPPKASPASDDEVRTWLLANPGSKDAEATRQLSRYDFNNASDVLMSVCLNFSNLFGAERLALTLRVIQGEGEVAE